MTATASLLPVPFEDRYETRRQLWLDGPHGGWLTYDRILCREVVLNIPYRPNDNCRFITRAKLRASLRHANLIPIFDFSVTSEGKPYFTEPYFPIFFFLDDFLNDGSQDSLRKLARFQLQVCEAVRYLHSNDLLHLNLTPKEVLIVQPFEEVFLVRGLPSLPAGLTASEYNSLTFQVSGSLGYMAPEQLDPDRNGPITVQTDVYGLGGILYFTLYGKAPNESLSMTKKDILESLATGKGSPTRGRLQFTERSSRKLAKRLEPICLRALNRDLARRHESVMEFTKDLVGALML